MKVTHFNTYATGGAAIAARRIHFALHKNGVNSQMAYLYPGAHAHFMKETEFDFRSGLSLGEQAYTKLKNKLVETRQLKTRNALSNQQELFSFMRSAWRIENSSFYKSANIIHFHWTSRLLDYESFFEKNAKPVVFTLHDYFPFSGGYHYPVAGSESLEIVKNQQKIWRNILNQHQIHFVTPSAFLRKSILEMGFDFLEKNFEVIHNPVPADAFELMDREEAQKKLGLEKGLKYVLFVADNIEYYRKGFDRIIPIVNTLPGNVCLLVVGSHSSHSSELLEHEKITWLGHAGNEEKMNWIYNAADITVHPSRMDNYPNVITESQACGTPVVAFNCGGMTEMIQQGINGFLVNTDHDLQPMIEKALQHNWNRISVTSLCFEENGENKVAQKYLSLYKRLAR